MYKILIFLLLISFTVNAQVGKRTKWKSGIERCLDSLGDPIENCFGVSGANGEFLPTTIEDVLAELNIANESAVDSIYTNNDTLFIVYFSAPTLKYKASGLNGIFSASNQNKLIGGGISGGIFTSYLPSSAWVLDNNLAGANNWKATFANSLRQLQIVAGSSQQAPLRVTGFVSNLSNGKDWRSGGILGGYEVKESSTANAGRAFYIEPRNGTSNGNDALTLEADGDITMGGYTSVRSFSTNPLNFSGWDANGTFQKYEIQDLIDTVQTQFSEVSYSNLEQNTGKTWLDGDTIYTKTFSWGSGVSGVTDIVGFAPEDIGVLVNCELLKVKSAVNGAWANVAVFPQYNTLPVQEYRISLQSNMSEQHCTVYYTKP